jgi:hypothetical protein
MNTHRILFFILSQRANSARRILSLLTVMPPLLRRQVLSGTRSILLRSCKSLSSPRLLRHVQPFNVSSTPARAFTSSIPRLQEAYATSNATQQSQPNSFTKFADLQDQVHPHILAALTQDMGLETMTEVQQRTLAEGLNGQDVYVLFHDMFRQ